MGLFITSINSGSNGNCYYVGNENEAVLIDAGLTCRETEKRMLRLKLDIKKVKAIFVSHEHGDHIKGVSVISTKHKIPVYVTPKTLRHSRLELKPQFTVAFEPHNVIRVGDLEVIAFPKFHDAADAHSFLIVQDGIKIGVFTDLGRVCDQLIMHFQLCHAAFLEANYDTELLEKGRYPIHLKRRISGGLGHLSNLEAFELFVQHRAPHLSHLFLSHLSADNNNPDLAAQLFKSNAGNTEIIVASRYEETPVYHISKEKEEVRETISAISVTQQLSLF